MTEEWRPVLGYEGRYEASDEGHVRSLDRVTSDRLGRRHVAKGRVVTKKVNPQTGRPYIPLYRAGARHCRHLHILVLEAFVGPRPDGLIGCHNDGNPLNNALANLRWDTPSSNNLDAVKHGTHAMANKTHCIHGHEFTPENTFPAPRPTGMGRACRACRRERGRRKEACPLCGEQVQRNSKYRHLQVHHAGSEVAA